jgi:tRNA-splicing ligase RtcB
MSMPVASEIREGRVPVRVYARDIDANVREQLANVSKLPIVGPFVAAMPDVHLGKGASVGAVIPNSRAVIPAAVGVDIGCGMMAVRLSLNAEDLPDSLRGLRAAIEGAVPVGFKWHDFDQAPAEACLPLERGYRRIVERHPEITGRMKNPNRRWIEQMGTLGGGNHFIEVCLDESGRVWVMLHSGSRGIGNAIGTYFIELAKRDMERHIANLPHKDLAYLKEGSKHFDDYMDAVGWAQDYARANREAMMRLILDAIAPHLPPFEAEAQAVNCHHNYVQREQHFGREYLVTRKGAIRAGAGELGIIPGSMGAKSYIVRGRGNPDSLMSSAHGAGRRMSRTQAKKRISMADFAAQTRGVECRRDKGVLDEAPGAYKDIDEVMAQQSDLVEIVHTLKQVVCVKG